MSETQVQAPPAIPAGQPPAGTPPPAGEMILGKFKTPDDFGKAHGELAKHLELGDLPTFKDQDSAVKHYQWLEKTQGRLGSAKAAAPSAPADDGSLRIGQPAAAIPDDEDLPGIFGRAGVSEAELVAEWTKSGKLTDEQYTKLTKARPGLGKAVINEIAEGRKAKAELSKMVMESAVGQAAQFVGGKDQLANLLADAGKFIPASEQDGFNKLLADHRTVGAAVKTLKTMHAEWVKSGNSGNLANAGGGSASSGAATSRAELNELIARANRGDDAARRRVIATTQEVEATWQS